MLNELLYFKLPFSHFFFTYTANTESGVSLQLKIRNCRKNDTNSRIYPQQKTCFLHLDDNDKINVPMIYWPKLESAGVARFQAITTFVFLTVFSCYFLNIFTLFLSLPFCFYFYYHTLYGILSGLGFNCTNLSTPDQNNLKFAVF